MQYKRLNFNIAFDIDIFAMSFPFKQVFHRNKPNLPTFLMMNKSKQKKIGSYRKMSPIKRYKILLTFFDTTLCDW